MDIKLNNVVLYSNVNEISLGDYDYTHVMADANFNSFKELVSSSFLKELKGLSLFEVLQSLGKRLVFSSAVRPEFRAWEEFVSGFSFSELLSDDYQSALAVGLKDNHFLTDPQAVFDFSDLLVHGGECRQLAVASAAVLDLLGYDCSFRGVVHNDLVDDVPYIAKSFDRVGQKGQHLWLSVGDYSVDPAVFVNTLHDDLSYDKVSWLKRNGMIKLDY